MTLGEEFLLYERRTNRLPDSVTRSTSLLSSISKRNFTVWMQPEMKTHKILKQFYTKFEGLFAYVRIDNSFYSRLSC